MKHVFIVHSHTLFLTSMGAIEYLHLNHKNVIFICTRNYDTSLTPVDCVKIRGEQMYKWSDEIYYSQDKKFIKSRLIYLDQYLSELITDEYELFVPHLSDPLFQLMYTHPMCTKVSYVQEGAYTINNYFINSIPFFQKIKRRLWLMYRYGNTRFYCYLSAWYTDGMLHHQKTLDVYAVYEEFFKGLKCVSHIVSWPDYDKELPNKISGPVFVFDGFVTNNQADQDYYLEKCRLLIKRYHQDHNLIKFHPAQNKEERDDIISMFKEINVSYQEMDESIPFELYIIRSKKMTVVGFGSSLLYYAQSRGHHVICCDTWMMGDPKYKDNHDRGCPFFHDFFNIDRVTED